MDPRRCAQYGKAAVDAGTPDRGQNDKRTDAIDAVANILHHLDGLGEEDSPAILSSAVTYYYAEKERGL